MTFELLESTAAKLHDRQAIEALKKADQPFSSMSDYRFAVDMLASVGASGVVALLADRDRLAAEVERMGRNRDMWKTQCENQARQLEAAHIAAVAHMNLIESRAAIDSQTAGKEGT
jgi:hypothetical protein